jgi:hypothetical protein
MPSIDVRSQVRAAWPQMMPSVRYIDTINRSLPQNPPLPLPPVWGTLAFDAASRRQLTMGRNPWIEEQGVVTIVIVAKSGHGDGPGIEAASAAMQAWDGWISPRGDIWFQNVGAPRQMDDEATGDWFIFGVPCEYRAQERMLRALSLPAANGGYAFNGNAAAFLPATP